MFTHEIVFIVLAVCFGIFMLWLVARYNRRVKVRTARMADFATELGWRFYPEKDASHSKVFSEFKNFERRGGAEPYAYNSLFGELLVDGREYEIKLGDFTFSTETGDEETKRYQQSQFSYLIVSFPFQGISRVVIRPERIVDKLKGVVGLEDINFESAEFSRAFFVQCDDKRFVYDLIDSRMMDFLLRSNPPIIKLENDRGLFVDDQRLWSVHRFRETIKWLKQFLERWPEHLLKTLSPTAEDT